MTALLFKPSDDDVVLQAARGLCLRIEVDTGGALTVHVANASEAFKLGSRAQLMRVTRALAKHGIDFSMTEVAGDAGERAIRLRPEAEQT